MKKIAVILTGSGYLDGSEIREAVGALWALSRHTDVQVQCFAYDRPQHDVVNHVAGKPAEEQRNQLLESARIARGQVRNLSELKADDFDGLILPGGFGAAKNLCTFAMEGPGGTVMPEIQSILEGFHGGAKPIGALCIAPAVLAMAFPEKGIKFTVGDDGEAAQALVGLGHTHEVKAAKDVSVDEAHRVATAPAYMYDDAPLHEVFEGIQKVVDQVVAWAR